MPTLRFTFSHPLHALSLGLGSGLSPWAPGTAGTLAAWLGFACISSWMSDLAWAWTLLIGLMGGIWASTYTARQLGHSDPSAIVCDEILAFWLILWLITPTPFWEQLLAFGLFRYFDAAKPGPVHWADQRFKAAPPALDGVPDDASKITWRQGWGIMFDDLVAAFCTLFVIALLRKVF